jgi:hypothetical protein
LKPQYGWIIYSTKTYGADAYVNLVEVLPIYFVKYPNTEYHIAANRTLPSYLVPFITKNRVSSGIRQTLYAIRVELLDRVCPWISAMEYGFVDFVEDALG